MRRIAIVFEYVGTNFSGYQSQPQKRTVQGEMESIISLILDQPTKIYASGRTDSGVHSLGQVAHFDIEKSFNLGWFQDKLNSLLPEDISIQKVFEELDFEIDDVLIISRKFNIDGKSSIKINGNS